MENNQETYICFKCQSRLEGVHGALEHLKSIHGIEQGKEEMKCMKLQSDGVHCVSLFRTFAGLKKHLTKNICKLMSSTEHQSVLASAFGNLSFNDISDNEKEKKVEPKPLSSILDSIILLINGIGDKLNASNVQHSVLNDVFEFSEELVTAITELNKELIRKSPEENTTFILESTKDFLIDHIGEFKTRLKRDRNYRKNTYYVEPKALFVGDGIPPDNILYFVSPVKTLESLFKNENFRAEYFNYNNNHHCTEGIYERYCCGKMFKKSEIFKKNENAIQLQFYYDDFQLTSPLKTKPRKVCAIYFVVHNFSSRCNSRLENIYLVALCDSKLVDKNGINAIFQYIVHDIKYLEEVGVRIPTDDGEFSCLKGTLVQVSFDNLGGNTLFGLPKSFRATYYCRICFCTYERCQCHTKEKASKIRTKDHYERAMTTVNDKKALGVEIKTDDAFGFTNYCILNDLNYYHTIDNRSQDVMHDIYEGAMPLVLHSFFSVLTKNKIVDGKQEIIARIDSFDYGILESRNKPSKLTFAKNLNQNASQTHCLMKHIPFIFGYLLQHEKKKRKISLRKPGWS